MATSLIYCGEGMTEITKVWFNRATGMMFRETPDGLFLGRDEVVRPPEWVQNAPDEIFGPVVEWTGGDCPVELGHRVLCHFRGRSPYVVRSDAHGAMWQHAPAPGRPNPAGDIIAYQERA